MLEVYRICHTFPGEERYGLTSQLQRAAVSVPANIAEGFGKRNKPEKGRYLNIANGSLEEIRYYLILAKDLGFCEIGKMKKLAEDVSRLLRAYHRKIQEA